MACRDSDKPFSPDRVWVVTNPHPGNRSQAIGLAEALGWDYEVKELHFTPWSRRRRYLPFLPLTAGLDRQRSSPLQPPWPDLVIGVGRSTAPVTRWIGRVSQGRTRTVQIGRGGGPVADCYDAVITPLHCRMPPDARRYGVLLSLNPISPEQLAEAGRQWPGLLDGAPRPVIALLVGGDASRFRLSADDAAAMASQVRSWAEESGGSVIAVTSRRTSQRATEALQAALPHPHRVYAWQPGQTANPYRALLAQADVLVVTGESESMLAEAAATTAPVYIFPVREVKSDRLRSRLSEWGVRRACAHFSKESRGAAGSMDACLAWMMWRGLLPPRRDMNMLHDALYASGRARPFGAPLHTDLQQPLREAPEVARWLKNILR